MYLTELDGLMLCIAWGLSPKGGEGESQYVLESLGLCDLFACLPISISLFPSHTMFYIFYLFRSSWRLEMEIPVSLSR